VALVPGITGRREALCAACLRIRDKLPAGFLTLGGDFLKEHRGDIMHLVRNTVDAQQMEHPMKRVMDITGKPGAIEITFTDIHLPRTVGKAIERAYDGDLDTQFARESGIVRAYWSRAD
jgi:hypothetical protein